MGLELAVLHSCHGSPVPESIRAVSSGGFGLIFLPHPETLSQMESTEPSGVKQLLYITISTKAWRQMQGFLKFFLCFFKSRDQEDLSVMSFLQRGCFGQEDPKEGPDRPVTIGSLGPIPTSEEQMTPVFLVCSCTISGCDPIRPCEPNKTRPWQQLPGRFPGKRNKQAAFTNLP